ncbi:uncharacterized protein DUF3349 [Luteococcus japonicus]|uniref:DUF3349 domain-containing protein n=2 Tax=Luteococcus japonicus TaxID=33984 RepID=A0A1R4KMW6_9ACTN|nr:MULTISPECIES: DUF3349 domain-containing protein [Luteococcus]MDN5563247.1 DUF3349 domain-containing protein [Luteococcus sp.]ROR55551.1 uncharacterized protein DUF3349 [Luteococcus japonicus]SJN45618.1 hypothetical protein FM114_16170 [Luteococcus japonicus LSP_Lj1]
MFSYLDRVIDWLKAGYPQGIPDRDYIPLVAVLKRRLTSEEIQELGHQLTDSGLVPADRIDVGTGYLAITDELPSVEELDRVTLKLREAGWPVDNSRWREWPGPSTDARQP